MSVSADWHMGQLAACHSRFIFFTPCLDVICAFMSVSADWHIGQLAACHSRQLALCLDLTLVLALMHTVAAMLAAIRKATKGIFLTST
eukprot:1161945-Pelagomonas_calceolata.AAC.3